MFKLPPLPYGYSSLEPYIDKETMRIHHNKHHGAYVDNLNAAVSGLTSFKNESVEEILQSLDKIPHKLRTKIKNNAGGHYNHSLFWLFMSPKPKNPGGNFLKAINSQFGDRVSFEEKFSQVGLSRFGSGWVWLIVKRGKLEIVDTPNQDNLIEEGVSPILGLDVWEHAYYLKYQNRRADYIKAWWNVVNWQEVEKRFSENI